MISPESIQNVRERVRLSDLMREECDLKRSGSRWVCCCPFHGERTPSCFVNDDTNTFHCFGCGESGDAISYVMRSKGFAFAESVEYLAAKAGIDLVRIGREGKAAHSPDHERKEQLVRALTEAHRYFRWCYERAPEVVQSYIMSRGLTPAAVDAFGIGFAPVGGDSLVSWLRKAGVSDDVAVISGLLKRDQSGQLRPSFRGRLQFPIVSERNQVVGFGGRLVPALYTDGRERPKYINSLESPLYRKHKTLYGLPVAMRAIRERGEVYVVEGYLDVVGLWQVGVRNVVACCGTALTSEHGDRLARLVRRVVLLFDGDDAGRVAAARAFKTVANLAVDVWVSFLPEGEDPDDLARRLGAGTEDFLSALPRRSLLSAFLDEQFRRHGGEDMTGPVARSAIGEEIRQVLAGVTRDVVRHDLEREAASRLRIDPGLMALGGRTDGIESRDRVSSEEGGRWVEMPSETSRGRLTAVEQQLLLAVMAQWETLPAVVLADPRVCGVMSPSVLEFLGELRAVVAEESGRDAEKRARVKDVLRSRGGEWIELWRRSRTMAAASGTDPTKWYDDCVRACRRQQMVGVLIEIERQIEQSNDESARAVLLGRKLDMRRQLDRLTPR